MVSRRPFRPLVPLRRTMALVMVVGLLLQGLWAQTYALAGAPDAASFLLPSDICHAAGADRPAQPDVPTPIGHHPAHCPLCQFAGAALLPQLPPLPQAPQQVAAVAPSVASPAVTPRAFALYAARGPPTA